MSLALQINGVAVTIDAIQRKNNDVSFVIEGTAYHFTGHANSDGSFSLDYETEAGEWVRERGVCWKSSKNAYRIQMDTLEATVSEKQNVNVAAQPASPLSPVSPMPGLVRSIFVKKGATVSEGQALIVFEAMKLQITMSAGCDAVVENVLVSEGQLVPEGTELVTLTAIKT